MFIAYTTFSVLTSPATPMAMTTAAMIAMVAAVVPPEMDQSRLVVPALLLAAPVPGCPRRAAAAGSRLGVPLVSPLRAGAGGRHLAAVETRLRVAGWGAPQAAGGECGGRQAHV
jgi:hypothetical protein